MRRPNQPKRQSGLYPLGFSPHLGSDILDFSGTFGLKTSLHGWGIDMSNDFGSNSFTWTIFNSNNASLGLKSPITFDAGKIQYSQNVINVDVAKSLPTKIPLNIAFGTEFRLENFDQEAGSQVFPGYQRTNEVNKSRYNIGFYTDIEADITDKWLVSLAARFEKYSDFGDNFSWKIAQRYRVLDNVTLRGAYSTGFRAPSLPQKYFSSYTLQFISIPDPNDPTKTIIDGVNIAHLNDDSYVTRQFGIPNLKSEISQNISIGITAKLWNNLSLSLDIYQIDIKDRIGITGRFKGSDDPRFKTILDNAGLSQVQFMTNAIDTKTRGLDFVGSYSWIINNNSDLVITLGSNFTQTRVPRDEQDNPIIHTGEVLKGFGSQLFNREEVSRIEVAQPRSKVTLGFLYSLKNFKTNLIFTRFGEVQYIHPSDQLVANTWNNNALEIRDQTFSPKVLTSLNLPYLIKNSLEIEVGGTNIFNVYPDRHTHSGNYSGGMFPYSRRVSQFGLSGAGFYVGAKLDF